MNDLITANRCECCWTPLESARERRYSFISTMHGNSHMCAFKPATWEGTSPAIGYGKGIRLDECAFFHKLCVPVYVSGTQPSCRRIAIFKAHILLSLLSKLLLSFSRPPHRIWFIVLLSGKEKRRAEETMWDVMSSSKSHRSSEILQIDGPHLRDVPLSVSFCFLHIHAKHLSGWLIACSDEIPSLLLCFCK